MKFFLALLALAFVAMAVEVSDNVTGDIDKAIKEVCHMAEGISYSSACQTHDCVVKLKTGDCWGMSDFLACELKKRGVEAKALQYSTDFCDKHRSVVYNDTQGEWVRFPNKCFSNPKFWDTDDVFKGKEVPTTC